MFDDQGITADVPPRLESDPGMRLPDRVRIGAITAVERAGADRLPVIDLSLLSVCDVTFGAEELPRLLGAADLVVELVEPNRQLPLDDRLELLTCSALFASSLTNRGRSARADSVAAAFCCIAGPRWGPKLDRGGREPAWRSAPSFRPGPCAKLARISRRVARCSVRHAASSQAGCSHGAIR